jgi:hypothetical protein
MSDYHGRMMNIPATEWGASYKHGHRDARHAAAEVALEADAEIAALRAVVAEARDALERIQRWFGEFPATGRQHQDGSPMSYGWCFGSNGERDFMREVARAAIARIAALDVHAQRDDEITRLRAAGEEALHQLVILNGNWASEAPGLTDGWRIDTSEAIASLKAALPAPPVDAPAQPSHP